MMKTKVSITEMTASAKKKIRGSTFSDEPRIYFILKMNYQYTITGLFGVV